LPSLTGTSTRLGNETGSSGRRAAAKKPSANQSQSARRPRSPKTDRRFFRLFDSLGGRVTWQAWMSCPRANPRQDIRRRVIPPGVLPSVVKRDTPADCLEILCAAQVALVQPDVEQMDFIVSIWRGQAAQVAVRSLLRPRTKISVRLAHSMRAALRRIAHRFRPTIDRASRLPARCYVIVCWMTPVQSQPSPREVFAARGFLREFFSKNGIALWATAPDWLRPAETP